MNWAILVVAAYLLGSLSPAIMISKYMKKRDVRELGSGNAGSTNMARSFGMKTGLLAFACDMLKTLLALAIGQLLAGEAGAYLAGACCFLGHCKPIYYRFKGGKGVTCAMVIVLCTDWRIFLLAAICFFGMFFWKKTVSLSSLTAVAGVVLGALCLRWGDWLYLGLVVYLAGLVTLFHGSNIKRLLRGEEPQFQPKH